MNDFIGGAGYNKPTEEQVKAKKNDENYRNCFSTFYYW